MAIPDNYSAWERHEVDLERELAKRPVCSICDEHIQDDYAYNINGELICSECMERHFKVNVEDYIQ